MCFLLRLRLVIKRNKGKQVEVVNSRRAASIKTFGLVSHSALTHGARREMNWNLSGVEDGNFSV